MVDFKELPKTIWANILFFIYVILALIGGVIARHISEDWSKMPDIRLEYDLFFGLGLSILAIAAIIGLLLKMEWGRQLSIAFCSVLFISNFVFRVAAYFYFKLTFNTDIALVDPDAVVTSLLSFIFIILLTRNKIKNFYNSGNSE